MIKVYVDGACSGNPGPGGWAAIVVNTDTGQTFQKHGGEAETTNNRMEITAAISGLTAALGRYGEAISESGVEIISDSQYVVNTMSRGWQRNKNTDLWDILEYLSEGIKITWTWVRGHNGDPYNEMCDRLAVRSKNEVIRANSNQR